MVAHRPTVDILASPIGKRGILPSGTCRRVRIARLTRKQGGWVNFHEFAGASAISPDGKLVAYSWANREDIGELRIVGIDGSDDRLVAETDGRWSYLEPVAWLPDGKSVLAVFDNYRGPNAVVSVAIESGRKKSIKTLGRHFPAGVTLSPDGAYAVFDVLLADGRRDISVAGTDSDSEHMLVEHPADEVPLGWAPDGDSILFLSDRTGEWDAWLIGVSAGKPAGRPTLVKRAVGQIKPVGFTSDGSFYFGTEDRGLNVFSAILDAAGEKIEQRPGIAIQRFLGKNADPSWSPDGQRLAYISRRGPSSNRGTICIRTLESGEEQETVPELLRPVHIQWSDDAASIFTFGASLDNQAGIHRLNLVTGDTELTVPAKEFSHPDMYPRWAVSGKTVYLAKHPESGANSEIIARNLRTGTEESLTRSANQTWFTGIYPSPDGRKLALRLAREMNEPFTLLVMPSSGGGPRELLTTAPGVVIRDAAWNPDGESLFYIEHTPEPPAAERWELRSINIRGGQPKVLGHLADGKTRVSSRPSLSVHPDGPEDCLFRAHSCDGNLGDGEHSGCPRPIGVCQSGPNGDFAVLLS